MTKVDPSTADRPLLDALSPAERDAVAVALAAGFADRVQDVPASDERSWWRVLATDRFDAWLIDWPERTAVRPHDHGGSAASIAVVRGVLREDLITADGTESSVLVPERVHRVAPDSVHDVTNPGPARATSIHVYSPPLRSMVFYDLDRTPVRHDDVEVEPTLWSTILPGAS